MNALSGSFEPCETDRHDGGPGSAPPPRRPDLLAGRGLETGEATDGPLARGSGGGGQDTHQPHDPRGT